MNLLLEIRKSVASLEPKAEIMLYGSRVKGDAREESDYDILILVPYKVSLREEQKFRHKLLELEIAHGVAISTIVMQKEVWENKYRFTPLFQSVAQEGRRI